MKNSRTRAEHELDEKKTKTPISIDGNTFSLLDKEGTLNLRISNVDLQAFMAKHDVPSVKQYDAEMKDYVSTLHPVLDDQKRLKETFEKRLNEVKSS